jgi:hypothetical protein
MLNTNMENTSSIENMQHCLIVNKASNLCEDLVDEDDIIDETILHATIPNNAHKRQRTKKSYDKTNLRRSNRVRFKKVYS